ncbi:LysR family transcriptional regulator [Cytobacillus sp. FSL W7-1323]|uniref:LysR family transcriptional regulator n=1 Tax=Cytobacillus kochii TaxID=859143 RepID=A0A248TGX4_9BACI|nr:MULTISPECIES: LysR family transcriptional regulator [Cytobacillus]ASV67464.1 LysR family transcriptional regulator [Cytobacillus kochii]MDQ0185674.1 DNA-binding transcriptional LysR family regulator [Cytobacillus kochii]MEA1854789.1 LysR family transcriptional regulator [Cytobacillus sp. OWB-43]
MNLNDCHLLIDLYKTKNITHTANNLYTSQPALTYRIKQLEKKYEIELIVRGSKGIDFTEEGRILYEHAEQTLHNERLLVDQLANLAEEIKGTISIGASGLFALHHLPRILNAFKELYPNINIQLKTGWSSEMKEALNAEEIHLAIIRGNYSLNAKKCTLCNEELFIVSKNPFQKEDIPHLPFITYKTDPPLSLIIDKWWRTNFQKPVHPSIETDQAATCKEMVKYNVGIAVLPGISIEGEEDLYTISLNDFGEDIYYRETSLFYNPFVENLRHVKLFIDFLKSHYNV